MRLTVLLVLLAASANAATVHALGPPTPKAIKAVLEKGFEFDAGDNHSSFEARGRVSIRRTGQGAVVHLVPGAKDERLLTAASKLIEGLSAESADGYLFVRGVPVANARTVSEIFFGPKSETTATAIARKLEPVLGPIAVKPWPGQTTFQVVVVLGDTKAK